MEKGGWARLHAFSRLFYFLGRLSLIALGYGKETNHDGARVRWEDTSRSCAKRGQA